MQLHEILPLHAQLPRSKEFPRGAYSVQFDGFVIIAPFVCFLSFGVIQANRLTGLEKSMLVT